MNKLIIYLILSLIIGNATSQTAVDFNATSCDGQPYHLYEELDSNKIVVIGWAMPCGSCVVPLQTTFGVVQKYVDSLPGMVNMLICDDLANTSCSSLVLWAMTYGMENTLKFSDTSIKMTDYGETAMPKVVVVGGPQHQVFFVSDYEVDGKSLEKAIDSAITMITGVYERQELLTSMKMFPNPVNNSANITFSLQKSTILDISILNEMGQEVASVFSGSLSSGFQKINFSTQTLNDGFYIVQLRGDSENFTVPISISH
jgi:hypothetical protein